MAISVIMLYDTNGKLNVVGEPVRGDGYYGQKDGLHTVCFYLSNFTGRIYLDGSLASDPTERDWFPINLDGAKPYIQYPLVPTAPTGTSGDTMLDAYTFIGNFVYLRIRVDRSYVIPQPTDDSQISLLGSVTQVLLNH